jgi:hypothetical protein
MAEPTLSKKRYIPIVEAAKVSGYTYEYIHRLCRIGKIPCRIMGDKMIVELDSLLSQTGTILLGSEHVGFIEVDEATTQYPLVASTGETNIASVASSEKTDSVRSGRIAVVGDTFHEEEETEKNLSSTPKQGERFPSNALPFFSSVGKSGAKSGFHIPVSKVGITVPPQAVEKGITHLSIASDAQEAPAREVVQTTKLKHITVMPQSVPSDFVPTVPVATPVATPAPVTPSVTPPHDVTTPFPHDLDRYSSKLPMLLTPSSIFGKAILAVFAFGILVAPTALGIGAFLQGTIQDFGGALQSGARASMAAVGLIDPNKDSKLFPYLTETSRLLSASGATGNTQSASGVVVTPSTGVAATDQQIKDAIQKTFSDPVTVTPDGKDGQSGIIKPVFQKNNSSGYIYVMVPVRN